MNKDKTVIYFKNEYNNWTYASFVSKNNSFTLLENKEIHIFDNS
jgi:hypothetical protein